MQEMGQKKCTFRCFSSKNALFGYYDAISSAFFCSNKALLAVMITVVTVRIFAWFSVNSFHRNLNITPFWGLLTLLQYIWLTIRLIEWRGTENGITMVLLLLLPVYITTQKLQNCSCSWWCFNTVNQSERYVNLQLQFCSFRFNNFVQSAIVRQEGIGVAGIC